MNGKLGRMLTDRAWPCGYKNLFNTFQNVTWNNNNNCESWQQLRKK
jgi:hypothetical protein